MPHAASCIIHRCVQKDKSGTEIGSRIRNHGSRGDKRSFPTFATHARMDDVREVTRRIFTAVAARIAGDKSRRRSRPFRGRFRRYRSARSYEKRRPRARSTVARIHKSRINQERTSGGACTERQKRRGSARGSTLKRVVGSRFARTCRAERLEFR